jgi:hypothetical protein
MFQFFTVCIVQSFTLQADLQHWHRVARCKLLAWIALTAPQAQRAIHTGCFPLLSARTSKEKMPIVSPDRSGLAGRVRVPLCFSGKVL